MSAFEGLKLERLHPEQIYAALDRSSIIYIPLGALEWHGQHLPIGLDGLTSHGVCLRAATATGGLVMPPLYYGMTGSIGHHPWTILVEEESTLMSIYMDTLKRLEAFSVKLAVVFTGHFGRRQLALMQQLDQRWKEENHSMKLLALSIHDCPHAELQGDHGAIFETSVLKQLQPQLVHLDRLPGKAERPANDPDGDSWGPHRRDPEHVLFGVLGDDPRDYEEAQARRLLRTIIQWVQQEVDAVYKE